jgi:pyruvate formate lyase activating enzyme
MLSRREFLNAAAKAAPLTCAGFGSAALAWDRADRLTEAAPRARYWLAASAPGADCRACHDKVPARPPAHDPTLVKCLLCAQGCALTAGQRGRCRARANVKGELRTLVYGRPIATHVDPIEKKPFYHFLPGASAFSLATAGCPLSCKFCQNWTLSQASPEDYDAPYVAPSAIVAAAAAARAPVIAFTYNEPTVFVEYLLDIAAEGRARRIRSVLVSCGFMNEAPLADMCRALDAIKIDLKGYSDAFYRDVCRAALAPVLRSIAQIAKSGVHLEIVNLVVPTLNDSERMLGELSGWIAGEAGPDVPVHFTRFHPDYQLQHLPPTPVKTLERARELAQA